MRAFLFVPALAFACGGEPGGASTDGYEPELLATYREAIPAADRVLSGVPTADGQSFALTSASDAELARHGIAFARAVNQPARALVTALRTLTDLPPTRYDAVERSFIWGPWENDRGVGDVALVVTRNDSDADFEYSYALLRTMDADLAGATPVIAGGATPDPEDSERGVGVALWDLEANAAFEQLHDPAAVASDAGSGRFVMLFGHLGENGAEALFNVAVFRAFVPERDAARQLSDAPVDVDYFYGRFVGSSGERVDFVDTVAPADVCGESADTCFASDLPPGSEERFSYNAYFVNAGFGRAEVSLTDGDLESPAHFVECWSTALARTSFQVETDGEMVETMPGGSCSAPADQSAADLGLPTLSDIDPAMLDAMSCAAENGLVGCE